MIKYELVYDTFAGIKSVEYDTHKEAFKAYKAIVHTEKCVYMVITEDEDNLRSIITPLNSSFSPYEYGRVKAWKYLGDKYPNHKLSEGE